MNAHRESRTNTSVVQRFAENGLRDASRRCRLRLRLEPADEIGDEGLDVISHTPPIGIPIGKSIGTPIKPPLCPADKLEGMKIGDRIRERREALGLSQNELARRSKVSQPVIFSLERGDQHTTRRIGAIASALGVSVADLDPDLAGHKARPRQVDLVGYVAAGADSVTFADGQGPFDTVDAPVWANDQTVAVEVRGASLGPLLDRWLIFYDQVRDPPGDDMEGRLCVVGLADGRVMVKALRRARGSGLWHLFSNNGSDPPILDQEVLWAALVRGMQPK